MSRVCWLCLLLLLLPAPVLSAHELPSKILLQEPVLITSVGQGVDVFIVKAVFDDLGIKAELIPSAQPEDLEGFSQIVFVPCLSHKGLAASGVLFQDELNRVKRLMECATKHSCMSIMVYLESFSQRDGMIDRLLKIVASHSTHMVIYEKSSGPVEPLRAVAEKNEIPLFWVHNLANLAQEFNEIFEY